MPILDLFSKRQKRLRGEMPDVFVYDDIPRELRVQIVHIWRDCFGLTYIDRSPGKRMYEIVHDDLCREYGTFSLGAGEGADDRLEAFFLNESDVNRVIDVIELVFRMIDKVVRRLDSYDRARAQIKISPDDAIEELNGRFLESGTGYQYVSGEIIRKDSEFLHQEAVKPALRLLAGERFRGAEDEFLTAHERYRHGNAKDCLVYCLKAFESTLKTICTLRGWEHQDTDTARTLLDICFRNDLVPAFLRSHYSALKSTLESGVPAVRNKLGGHGQGAEVVDVPLHFASYMIHMTGSAILFLIEAERKL